MLTFLTRRRDAEDLRVLEFLRAIAQLEADDPDAETADEWLAAQRTDTVAFPRIILAGTIL